MRLLTISAFFVCFALSLTVAPLSMGQEFEEKRERGQLGLLVTIRHGDGYPEVMQVQPGLAADQAGLKDGDRILKINGKVVKFRNRVEMLDYFGNFGPREHLSIVVERDSELVDVELITDPMPTELRQALAKRRDTFAQMIEAGLDPCAYCSAPKPAQGEDFLNLLSELAEGAPENKIRVTIQQEASRFVVTVSEQDIQQDYGRDELPLWEPAIEKQLAKGEPVTFSVYSRDGDSRWDFGTVSQGQQGN